MEKQFHRWDIEVVPVLPGREIVVAYLSDAGFSMFEPNDKGVVVHGEVAEVDVALAQNCLEEVRAFAQVKCKREMVKQENWNAQWESEYPEVVIQDGAGAPRCTIRAPFHDPPVSGLDVVVAPQMSFGTGHHATTHLMSECLLNMPLEGACVLDMGCGTGVLALVAAHLGAVQVLGIDIELNAVQNAKDNVTLNPSLDEDVLTFELGDGSACGSMKPGTWDVVCANIQKNVLSEDMARYAHTLAPGGALFLSGFFEGDVPDMRDVVEGQNLECRGVSVMDGWACMHCGKPLNA